MADTIEAFVSKLKSEGIEQGKTEAEQLRSQARQEADQIITDAKSEAEKIIDGAEKQSNDILTRGRTELQLASRDAILKLSDALEKALRSAIEAPTEAQLKDAEFLKDVIKTIVQRYIDADVDSYAPVRIDVDPQMYKQLCDWSLQELHAAGKEESTGFDLRDALHQAGFEFNFRGATIEVTRDSVVDTLMELVSPNLRQIIREANKSGEGA